MPAFRAGDETCPLPGKRHGWSWRASARSELRDGWLLAVAAASVALAGYDIDRWTFEWNSTLALTASLVWLAILEAIVFRSLWRREAVPAVKSVLVAIVLLAWLLIMALWGGTVE